MNNIDDKFRLEGYEKIKITDVKEYHCLKCDKNMTWWSTDKEGVSHCPRCYADFNADEIKPIMVKRKMIRCNVCGLENYVAGVEKDRFMNCPCKNVMAIKYKRDIVQPKTVLTKQWNKELFEREVDLPYIYIKDSLSIDRDKDRLFITRECETEKDFIILRLLQTIATQDDIGFIYYHKGSKNKVVLICDDFSYYPYIGYVIWTLGEKPILRQWFILEEYRKKGYGTAILKFWYEHLINQSYFMVESANEVTGRILVKLNYASLNPDGSTHGKKCSFITCG